MSVHGRNQSFIKGSLPAIIIVALYQRLRDSNATFAMTKKLFGLFTRRLDIEAKVHHIAILYDIFLTFQAHFSGFF